MKKRILATLLTLTLSLGIIPMPVFAEEMPLKHSLDIEGELGEKIAKQKDIPGEYEVTVKVPGASQNEQYAEIIIMADASDSINNAGNWQHFKNMVNALGETLLSHRTSLKLTLMGFGIGAKHAGTFTTPEELKAFMEVATSEDFLQERSATNCEVGFTYVEEYLNHSINSNIEQTYIIYLSDAAANMTEKKFDISDWTQYYTKKNMSYIANAEVHNIIMGSEPLPVTKELYPELCEEIISLREEYAQDPDSVSEKLNAAMEQLLENTVLYGTKLTEAVFAESELSVSGEYSASQLEKIFQTYFRATVGKENTLYESFMNFFYVCFLIPMNGNMPNAALRAAQASLSLQMHEKVLGLYHVCYSTNTSNWMNPTHVENNYDFQYTNKVKYLYGGNFGEAIATLETAMEDIRTTIYKDVIVTDPMSQWVILDSATIAIYDGDTKIYQYGEGENTGWLIENPPVVDENGNPKEPIKLVLNDKGLYEITWFVKSGNLLINDHYSLRYTVNLNEEAEGYVPGTTYPLNDPTTVTYTDEDGENQTRDITVPDGVAYVVDYIYKSGTDGMDLPGEFVPVPVDTNSYTDKTSVDAQTPETLTFTDAENDGVWTFRAWDKDSKQIDKANITFVGEWVFVANPDEPSEPTTPDEPSEPATPDEPAEPTTPDEPAEPTTSNAQILTPPKTGDNSSILLWLGLMVTSGLGLISIVFPGRKKQEV